MFGFFKKKSYELKVVIGQNRMPGGSISEPVISIVKSFSEKGRWKIKNDAHPLEANKYGSGYSFTVRDTKTGEVYNIKSKCYVNLYINYSKYMLFPQKLNTFNLPSWMTEEERLYVVEAVDALTEKVNQRFKVIEDRQKSKDNKQAKVNQDKERQRLMDIYCNKES